jgi:hypothetical protein
MSVDIYIEFLKENVKDFNKLALVSLNIYLISYNGWIRSF